MVAWAARIAVTGMAGLVPAWAPATEAEASAGDAIVFDVDMMKSRGIDPRVAEYFMQQARFMPGMSLVTLTVNGQRKGAAMARFDEKGQLCLDARLLARAGLRVPPATGVGPAAPPAPPPPTPRDPPGGAPPPGGRQACPRGGALPRRAARAPAECPRPPTTAARPSR